MHQARRFRGLIVPVGFVSLLAVLLVPLPSAMLDVLIALNIALSIIILLTTVYMEEPLDFSAFPSLLLAATMYRLVLNIASTRLVLTADANSPEEAMHVAGHVIAAFGNFVAGDSLFVGVIIFLILVVVQFIVISKGATRISEVAARFTLDAMPGKQMAIDADLNAGIIDEKEARRRRARVGQEADFFGAMDGASKFVRGDAIAGIIITAVNILGGFAVGMVQKGWEAGKTAEVFTKLTIGDGLTSQIPALVVSIASALIVTRSGSKAQLGDELADQIASQPKGLIITGCFLILLAMTPLPSVPLIASALALFGIAYAINRSRKVSAQAERDAVAVASHKPAEPPPVESLLKVDTLELEVGHGLVGLVDAGSGGTSWNAFPPSGVNSRWSSDSSCPRFASETTCNWKPPPTASRSGATLSPRRVSAQENCSRWTPASPRASSRGNRPLSLRSVSQHAGSSRLSAVVPRR
jgi:flagellar biosynthesis protein FlhA